MNDRERAADDFDTIRSRIKELQRDSMKAEFFSKRRCTTCEDGAKLCYRPDFMVSGQPCPYSEERKQ